MTIAEILNELERLRDLTNDSGKAIIGNVTPAIRRLINPDVAYAVEAVEVRRVHVEDVQKEEPSKTTKKKK